MGEKWIVDRAFVRAITGIEYILIGTIIANIDREPLTVLVKYLLRKNLEDNLGSFSLSCSSDKCIILYSVKLLNAYTSLEEIMPYYVWVAGLLGYYM